MQAKFDHSEVGVIAPKGQIEPTLGPLAIEALKVQRDTKASTATIEVMLDKCDAAAAVLAAQTIVFAEARLQAKTQVERAAAKARYDETRALEDGFDRLARHLRSRLR